MEITRQTTIGEILTYDEDIAYILSDCGMHCFGCPASIGETLEAACEVHWLEVDDVLEAIHDYELNKKKKMEKVREKFGLNVV